MYYYESHMGGVYTTHEYLDYEDLYCEECGDSDRLIGNYDSFEEFLVDFANEIDYYGSGGYCLNTLIEDIEPEFDYKTALDIVVNNRNDVKIDRYKFFHILQEEYCPEHCTECPFRSEKYTCKIDELLNDLSE